MISSTQRLASRFGRPIVTIMAYRIPFIVSIVFMIAHIWQGIISTNQNDLAHYGHSVYYGARRVAGDGIRLSTTSFLQD